MREEHVKKYKRNSIKSTWKQDDIKIVFSDPEIQASESVVHVKDVDDILFYHYTMKVYRKTNKNWKKELVSYTWNSPALLCIEKMADELLKDDFDDGSWQMAGSGDSVWYKKSLETDSIVNEDYYQMDRDVRFYCGERLEAFSMTIGTGFDSKHKRHTDFMPCISINFLRRDGFLRFVNTVKNFIDSSILFFNVTQKEIMSVESVSRKIRHGKMYEYKDRYEGCGCNKLDYVYVPGEEISLTLKEKREGEDVFVDYKDCRLTGVENSRIGNGYITITGGYKMFRDATEYLGNKQIKIPVELIMYSSSEEPEERLTFNKKQCVNDFLSIMSDEEKEEFATTSLDTITKKWFDAVVNRNCLYRKEHCLKHEKKTAKKIIKKIQKKCEKELSAD